ncbi:60Kd inner membrane protein-domain-containing protein [Aspergillus aurantiobrunneus]
MLGGPGLKGRLARQQFAAFARSSRSMSSFRPQISRFPVRHGKILGGNTTWRPPIPSIALPAARFNSTSSTPNQTTPETQQTTELDIANLDISDIPERIGYLKSLGLDFGWGPSSMVEYLMEHIHIWSGLPWLGSIVATGIVIRFAMLPLFCRSADASARISNSKHILTPLRNNMLSAMQSNNQVEGQKWRAEIAKVNAQLGIKSSRVFIPMFLQVPFGYGCFRVIRGMSELPVPGLAMEKFAWVNDLTVPDPYFLLPVITSAFLFLSLKRGGEFGTMDQSQEKMRKFMMFGLPTFQFLFLVFFPAAVQMYFLSTGLFGLTQAYLLSSNTFRNAAGITIPQKQNLVQSPSSGGVDTGRTLRLLTEAIEREKVNVNEANKAAATNNEQTLSFIDRAINSIKESKNELAKETTQKVQEMSGRGPKKNPDGTLAEPPRLSDKDRKLAEDYEKRRKEEEEWKREERNHARREAHLKALENQREKAKKAIKNPKVKQ